MKVLSIGTVLVLAAYIAGWVLGATFGGNYASDVSWFGVRGYESTGAFGGYVLAACVGIFYAKKSAITDFSVKNAILPVVTASLFGLWLPEALQSCELTLLTAFVPALVVLAQGREKEERHVLAGIFFSILLLANLFMVASLKAPLENIWQATQGSSAQIPLVDQLSE